MCEDTLREIRELTATIKEAVSEAFEEKALENGHITSEKLKELFEDYHAQVVKAIDEQISSLKIERLVSNEEDSNSVNEDYPLLDGCVDEVVISDNDVIKYKLYTYDEKFWHVPKDFVFPKDAKLLTGWLLRVGGQPRNKCVKKRDGGIETIYNAPVRPIRLLKKKCYQWLYVKVLAYSGSQFII